MNMEPTKQCFKCLSVKPLSCFYTHKRMADGHLNKCKECTKTDVQGNYADKRVEKSTYERRRFQDPDRKQKMLEYQRQRRLREPEKNAARAKVGRELKAGRIQKLPCQTCGDPKSQAHHEDYSKPLNVEWLCFKCHRELKHGQVVSVAK